MSFIEMAELVNILIGPTTEEEIMEKYDGVRIYHNAMSNDINIRVDIPWEYLTNLAGISIDYEPANTVARFIQKNVEIK